MGFEMSTPCIRGPNELQTGNPTFYPVEMVTPIIDRNTLIGRSPQDWKNVILHDVAAFKSNVWVTIPHHLVSCGGCN